MAELKSLQFINNPGPKADKLKVKFHFEKEEFNNLYKIRVQYRKLVGRKVGEWLVLFEWDIIPKISRLENSWDGVFRSESGLQENVQFKVTIFSPISSVESVVYSVS